MSRCGIDLHGKQCCAAYKKEVGITDRGGELVGLEGGERILWEPRLKHLDMDHYFFLVVVGPWEQGRNYCRHSFFSKTLNFFML